MLSSKAHLLENATFQLSSFGLSKELQINSNQALDNNNLWKKNSNVASNKLASYNIIYFIRSIIPRVDIYSPNLQLKTYLILL